MAPLEFQVTANGVYRSLCTPVQRSCPGPSVHDHTLLLQWLDHPLNTLSVWPHGLVPTAHLLRAVLKDTENRKGCPLGEGLALAPLGPQVPFLQGQRVKVGSSICLDSLLSSPHFFYPPSQRSPSPSTSPETPRALPLCTCHPVPPLLLGS